MIQAKIHDDPLSRRDLPSRRLVQVSPARGPLVQVAMPTMFRLVQDSAGVAEASVRDELGRRLGKLLGRRTRKSA